MDTKSDKENTKMEQLTTSDIIYVLESDFSDNDYVLATEDSESTENNIFTIDEADWSEDTSDAGGIYITLVPVDFDDYSIEPINVSTFIDMLSQFPNNTPVMAVTLDSDDMYYIPYVYRSDYKYNNEVSLCLEEL